MAHKQRHESYARNLTGFLVEVAQALACTRPGNPLLKPQYVAADPPEQILKLIEQAINNHSPGNKTVSSDHSLNFCLVLF